MILRKLALENFGLYGGRAEIDLSPRHTSDNATPVVLIGGRNGAGKTTLLEAVRLALHGKRSLGASVSKSTFDDYLRSKLHRSDDMIASKASVAITFDYSEDGEQHLYTVRRSWSAHGARVVEMTEIERDGAVFSAVPRDEWESFLQDLVPPGVAQLFFFDGEKIQEIADGDDPDGQVADAIRGLLGIELVGRLRHDLSLYLARHRRAQDSSVDDLLEESHRDLAVAEREIARLAEQAADALTDRESRARTAEALHNRFVAEGGSIALERARFDEERRHLEREGEAHRQALKRLVNGFGPFLLAPKLIERMRTVVAADQGIDRRAAAQSLEQMATGWRSSSNPEGWTSFQLEEFCSMLQDWASGGSDASGSLRALGGRDRGLAALALIDGAKQPSIVLANAMQDNHEHLGRVDAALNRVNSDVTDSLLEDLKRAERDAGVAEELWRQRDMQLAEARGQMAGRIREHKRLMAMQEQAAAEQDRAALVVRITAVLTSYEERLLAQKVDQLSREFVRCFRELARKPGLIDRVDINPETFKLTLRNQAGQEVPRVALSAGEKQIYAIALLWALARTSGRVLPVIVDTPLARLDRVHRQHLVERYFPFASQQVIVLSTDAEIDGELRDALAPHLSHTIHLAFDNESRKTDVLTGYFDEMAEAKHAVQ
ncbi:MAG: DNA sulfur modification protein DndD [Pseudomonadota bacterium]